MKRLLIVFSLVVVQIANAEQTTATLHLPTMNCAMCPITVKKALKKVDGVIEARVTFENKQAKVVFDDVKTNSDVLIKATTDAGYPATLLKYKEGQ